MTRTIWLFLFLRFGIDTPWHRSAWEKRCRSIQSELNALNAVLLWEKSELLKL